MGWWRRWLVLIGGMPVRAYLPVKSIMARGNALFLCISDSGAIRWAFWHFYGDFGATSATLWVHVFTWGSMDLVLDDNRVHHPLRAR